MKIAQVAPLHESVPPLRYGGTERVVSYLTEELVRRGHDVTLFASGDSSTAARLVPCCEGSLRNDPTCMDPLARHVYQLEQVLQYQDEFDLIHFHTDIIHFPAMRRSRVPAITTMHGRVDFPELRPFFEEFHEAPLISISDAQRRPLPQANWKRTIYHGIDDGPFTFSAKSGNYFAFVGRFSPEKRPDRAIAIAVALDIPLRIAAKIETKDLEYFEAKIKPLLKHPLVDYVGEVGDDDKGEFLAGAKALLFPIDWPEPFGLVMVEAMACGTPVVAFRCGSVPEVVDDGITGYVVDDMESAIAAADRIGHLDRTKVREQFEARFSVPRMVDAHVELYRSMCDLTPTWLGHEMGNDGRIAI